ncbi:sensor histidine kinase [Ligilactobacillus equi]|uniref:sensor histidine kinase n=1 Tax=Ligilactobacillus equi TaxID=137357 RepID=UPI002ED2C346
MTKNKVYLYYIYLVYLIFPIGYTFIAHKSLWLLVPTIFFGIGYVVVATTNNKKVILVTWYLLLAYIISYIWWFDYSIAYFFFYIFNLIAYKFQANIKSYQFISASACIIAIAGYYTLNYQTSSDYSLMAMQMWIIFAVCLAIVYIKRYHNQNEQLQRELNNQNKYINLLAAENERNRIGRDLHDTLGHTFAMMTLKLELAAKQLEKQKYDEVAKQISELREISKVSMSEVRLLVDNLKTRTLSEELSEITRMMDLSEIDFELDYQLGNKIIAPNQQSLLVMVVRELITNVIKHSQASSCKLNLFSTRGRIIVEITDNGKGFKETTEAPLHSIRGRIGKGVQGIKIISVKTPTVVQVILSEVILE